MYDPSRGASFDTWATRIVINWLRSKAKELSKVQAERYQEIHHSQLMSRTDVKPFDDDNWKTDAMRRLVAVLPKMVAEMLQAKIDDVTITEYAAREGYKVYNISRNWINWMAWLTPILRDIYERNEVGFETKLGQIKKRYS